MENAWKRLGGVFEKVYKSLSEQDSDAHMKEFGTEAEKVAGELDAKDDRITALEGELATAKAGAEVVAGELVVAKGQVTAMEAELNAFGATKEAREAYKVEHVRLSGWYDEQKGKKDDKGDDAGSKGAKTETETKVDKKAELKEKFGKLF